MPRWSVDASDSTTNAYCSGVVALHLEEIAQHLTSIGRSRAWLVSDILIPLYDLVPRVASVVTDNFSDCREAL